MDAQERKPEHRIEYFVNGEAEQTSEHKLTVDEILVHAGFTPAKEYTLTREEGHHKYTDYDEQIPVRQGERFTAAFLGPTPTS